MPPLPSHIGLATLSLGVIIGAAFGCASSAPPPKPVAKKALVEGPDPCIDSKPKWRDYTSILKHVRCEQEMFLTMSDVQTDLGVTCGFCHIGLPEKGKFDFPTMTPKKEIAMWMNHTFMTELKRADGEAMTCGSCHTNKQGKSAAKFLGEPRDVAFTLEWMNLVMVNRFVTKEGEKLKCKTCHVETWGKETFDPKVILRTDHVPNGGRPFTTAIPEPMTSASADPEPATSASAAPSAAPAPTTSSAPSAAPSVAPPKPAPPKSP